MIGSSGHKVWCRYVCFQSYVLKFWIMELVQIIINSFLHLKVNKKQQNFFLTWLKYLIIRAVSHIKASQFHSHLIAAGLAHSKGHFNYVGLGLLQHLLGDRNVQSQLDMCDVDL